MPIENRYKIKANTKRRMFQDIPTVVANDNIIFEVELYDDSTFFLLDSSYSYKLVSLRPSRKSVIRDGMLSGGLLIFNIGSSETLEAGKVEGTVQIYDSNLKRISSATFDYIVKKDPAMQGGLPTDDKTLIIANESLLLDSIDKLEQAMSRVNELITKAPQPSEVVDARGGEVTLGARLNKFTTELVHIAEQVENGGGAGSGLVFEEIIKGDSINIQPPSEVTEFNVTNKNMVSVTLSWTGLSSQEVKDYAIYKEATLVGYSTDTTFTISGLTSSTAYNFTVKARNIYNVESTGVSITTTTDAPDITAPEEVQNLTVSNMSSVSAKLTWDASISPDVAAYEVWMVSPTTGFLDTVMDTQFVVSDLTAQTNYTLKVKAKDNSGNISTGVTTSFTTILPMVVLSDNFNRADQTGLGTATTGQVWENTTGASIVSNQAKLYNDCKPLIQTNLSDNLKVTTDFYYPSSSLSTFSLVLRWIDASNYVVLERSGANLQLKKVVKGVSSTVGSAYSLGSVTYPSTIKVSLQATGTKIKVFVNDVNVKTETISDNLTGTKCGIKAYDFGSVQVRFDNFKVEAL